MKSLVHQRIGKHHYAVIVGGVEIGRVAKIGEWWIAYYQDRPIGGRQNLRDADTLLWDRAKGVAV